MVTGSKNRKYSFRVSLEMLERLKFIANELGQKLPDLIVTSVLMLYARATNQSEFLREKATFIANDAESSIDAPTDDTQKGG